MRTYLKISSIALVAAILATAPAGAASLNLGKATGGLLGDTKVDVKTNDGVKASVKSGDTKANVTLGGSGDKPVKATVDTGGSNGIKANANVDTSDGVGVNANLGAGGDTDVNANVSLGGSRNTTAHVGTTTGLLGNGSNPDATVDVNGGGLLGGSGPTTGNINLGGSDGTNAKVIADLFGPGDDARVDVTNGGGGLGGLDVIGDDANASVIIDLFGDNGGGGSGTGGNGNGGSGNGGNGNGGGSGGNGSGGNGGSSGTGGFNDGGNNGGGSGTGGSANGGSGSGGTGIGGGSSGGGTQVASLGAMGGACFTPDPSQIAKLAGRHAYTKATFSAWASVKQLKVVNVDICEAARSKIAGTGNVAALQNFLASSAALKAGLKQQGHTARDVIAADKSGSALILYVM